MEIAKLIEGFNSEYSERHVEVHIVGTGQKFEIVDLIAYHKRSDDSNWLSIEISPQEGVTH
jgi:hypothetical protein